MMKLLCTFVLVAFGATLEAQVNLAAAVNITQTANPALPGIGDFDRDGDLDFAVASRTPDKMTIYSNNGSGTFSAIQTIPLTLGSGAHCVVAADFDGDLDLDLAVTLRLSATVTYLINTNGTFAASGVNIAVQNAPRGIVSFDVDADGDMDIVNNNRGSASVSIIKNNGNATFAAPVFVTCGSEPRHVINGDVDGDGDQDLATSNADSSTISILLNNGSGTFVLGSSPSVGSFEPEGIALADLDGDGDRDLVIASEIKPVGTGPGAIQVLLNNGNGTFGTPTNMLTGGNDPGFVVPVDVDLDGDPDIVICNQDANNIAVFINNGSGTLAAPVMIPVGVAPDHGGWGDFDGNGTPDLITANDAGGTVSILKNLTPPTTLSFLTPPVRGTNCQIRISSPGDSGDGYFVFFALTTIPGYYLPDGRKIGLNPDDLTTLFALPNPFISNALGYLDANALGTVGFAIPGTPLISGFSIFAVGAVLNTAAPFSFEQFSGSLTITIQ